MIFASEIAESIGTTDTTFNLGKKLKEEATGCRLEVKHLATRKSLTATQKQQMADIFGAEEASVSGGRAVLMRRHPKIAPVFKLIQEAKAVWRTYTVHYEDGVRLIRMSRVEWMTEEIARIRNELDFAITDLRTAWDEIIEDAKQRLSSLFVPSDYASTPDFGDITVHISFPAIEPDKRLLTLAPEIYEAERLRIAARFEEAAVAAEAGLVEQFKELVEHLQDRLQPDEDGKRKIVRASSVDALVSFANRFKELKISDNADLEGLVEKAKQLAGGLDMKELRKSSQASAMLAETLKSIGEQIEIVALPKRAFEIE